MAVAMSRVRAALMLHRAVPQPQQCLLASLQLARTLVCKAVETPPAAETPPEAEKNTENKLLLDNLKVIYLVCLSICVSNPVWSVHLLVSCCLAVRPLFTLLLPALHYITFLN